MHSNPLQLTADAATLIAAFQDELPIYGREYAATLTKRQQVQNLTAIIMCLIALETRSSAVNTQLKAKKLHDAILINLFEGNHERFL